jgi:hypothetical protein
MSVLSQDAVKLLRETEWPTENALTATEFGRNASSVEGLNRGHDRHASNPLATDKSVCPQPSRINQCHRPSI